MTIRWLRCAFSRASSAKHSAPNGHFAAPRQSRWPTLTCRHSRSVCRGAPSRSPLPPPLASSSAHVPQLEHLLARRPCGHVDEGALVVGDALADAVQAGVVGAALEHGVARVDPVTDRLDQARDVALDQLVLQGQRGRRDHDPAVVQQARHEVGQRLAGAGAGLDEEVLAARPSRSPPPRPSPPGRDAPRRRGPPPPSRGPPRRSRRGQRCPPRSRWGQSVAPAHPNRARRHRGHQRADGPTHLSAATRPGLTWPGSHLVLGRNHGRRAPYRSEDPPPLPLPRARSPG